MNLAFADEIQPLNPIFNWRSKPWLNPLMVGKFDPVVLHFAGRGKPWNLQDDPFISKFSGEYREFLTKNFPDFAPEVALDTAQWRKDNPRHGIRLLDDMRIFLYRRRFKKKLAHAWYKNSDWKTEKMRSAIKEAYVG